jgi:hypothetical protein
MFSSSAFASTELLSPAAMVSQRVLRTVCSWWSFLFPSLWSSFKGYILGPENPNEKLRLRSKLVVRQVFFSYSKLMWEPQLSGLNSLLWLLIPVVHHDRHRRCFLLPHLVFMKLLLFIVLRQQEERQRKFCWFPSDLDTGHCWLLLGTQWVCRSIPSV